MTLHKMINKKSNESKTDSDSWLTNAETVLSETKQQCPSCNSTETEEHKYYWRCNANNCEVINFHTVQ